MSLWPPSPSASPKTCSLANVTSPGCRKDVNIFRMLKHHFKKRSIFNKSFPLASKKSISSDCSQSLMGSAESTHGDNLIMPSSDASVLCVPQYSLTRGNTLIIRKTPFRDSTNLVARIQAEIGDMENPGLKLRNGSLDTQFRSVDEVQDMIRHLQKIEEDMLRNGVSGNKSWCSSFEDLSLLQDTEFHIDDNETEWLVKFPGAKHTRAKDLESDESFIDGGLLNVRYGLLNLVKSALIEQKTAKFKSPPSISASSVNYLTITRKRNPPYTARNSPPRFDPEPVQNNAETNYGYNSGNGTSEFVSPPKSTVNTFNFLSPTRPSTFLDNLREREPDLDFLYASTPAKQIDSRTYTRPKKNRVPLDTHHITRDIPISPIRGSGAPEAAEPAPPAAGADQLGHVNMNETYVATDDAENQKESSDSSPPRRVTRNLSYVIRRDSDSPNNNSPSHPTENNESPPADLNSTFVRSREDVYSPSPTGSSNSIHTSSMEELHNMARMQEQTLRMSSGKVLTRKDTHIVHPESAGFRALPKAAMESQIPGQSKLRIHSRIPAPGLGSRIRPPMNGTRRPIANGGIRRPPDWQDDGAY